MCIIYMIPDVMFWLRFEFYSMLTEDCLFLQVVNVSVSQM